MASLKISSINFAVALPFLADVASVDLLHQWNDDGVLGCFGLFERGQLVGACAMIMEDHADGTQRAVMVAAQAKADLDAVDHCLPIMERDARNRGASSFAIDTRRPGLVRKLARKAADGISMRIVWELD